MRPWLVLAVAGGCSSAPTPRVEVDTLLTQRDVIGGNPLAAGRVFDCDDAKAAVAYAGNLEIGRQNALTLFTMDSDPGAGLLFNLPLDGTRLMPTVFGLPEHFELSLAVQCGDVWVHSPPFAMSYLPTVQSIAPPFNPIRFFATETPGDLWVCEENRLVRYAGGVSPAGELDLGFVCATSDLHLGPGGRRYLYGDSAGIALLDAALVVWSRPLRLVAASVDNGDPVVLRDENGDTVVSALSAASGTDLFVPVRPARAALGPLVRDQAGDILVLEGERGVAPPRLTYFVQRLAADGSDLGSIEVARYDWDAPSYLANFDLMGESIYVAAAPADDGVAWVEKIGVTADRWPIGSGLSLWASVPQDGWRYPLGEFGSRVLVASDSRFAWLQASSGVTGSLPFAPDSGNRFHRAVVEPDGALVMLGDPAGNLGQGLYLFTPDGRTALRFHPDAAIFRWVTTGWSGTLVSYFGEVHWLYSASDYDAMVP